MSSAIRPVVTALIPSLAPGSRRRAFTLVELLVLLGIIALLVSILLPAAGQAREQSRRAVCASNLHTLGQGLIGFAGEYKGHFPEAASGAIVEYMNPAVYRTAEGKNVWAALSKYIGDRTDVLRCPSTEPVPHSPWVGPRSTSDASYMSNAAVMDNRISSFPSPREVIMVQEGRYRWDVAWQRPERVSACPSACIAAGTCPQNDKVLYRTWALQNGSYGQEYSNVHQANEDSGAAFCLYLDCHVDLRLHRTLRPADFGLTGGPGATGSSADTNTVSSSTTYLPKINWP
jgi:hypothetical protein